MLDEGKAKERNELLHAKSTGSFSSVYLPRATSLPSLGTLEKIIDRER